MGHDASMCLHSSTFCDETAAFERKTTGKHRKANHYYISVVRMLGWLTLNGVYMWDQQTPACSSSSTSGPPQAHPYFGSWILTKGHHKNRVVKHFTFVEKEN